MKPNAKKAYDALKAIGAPVLDPDLGWGGHFAISGEAYGRDDGFYPGHKDNAPDGNPWAYYWGIELDPGENWSVMGIHKTIVDILKKHGLYSEWVNAGVAGVYDA